VKDRISLVIARDLEVAQRAHELIFQARAGEAEPDPHAGDLDQALAHAGGGLGFKSAASTALKKACCSSSERAGASEAIASAGAAACGVGLVMRRLPKSPGR